MITDDGRPPRRHRLGVVALLGAVIFTVLGTQSASAHNALVGTVPADGTTVATPPAAVVLTFNEPALATGTKVLVTGPDGSATEGDPKLVDTTVQQGLRPGLPAGNYSVEWRVTSADGHPINGAFTFTVTTGAAGSASSTPQTSGTAATQPVEIDGGTGGSSGRLWLLAIIPVGLAGVLGWRFSRRPGRHRG